MRNRIVFFMCIWALALHAETDRVAFRGIVTHKWPADDYFFMEAEDGRNWRVSVKGRAPSLSCGDTVYVDGVLEPKENRHTTRLFDAVVERKGHDDSFQPRYEPMSIPQLCETQSGKRLPSPDWYARPVAVTGKVHDFWRTKRLTTVEISDGVRYILCHVSMPMEDQMPEYLGIGALVRVRGIAVYTTRRNAARELEGIENIYIHAIGVDAVEVLSRPPFWTVGRVLAASGMCALALILVIAFLQRRRVRERIAAEAATRERLRLSHDLHDGFQQLLASCSFSLAATTMAVQNGASSDEILAHLEKAETALKHTQTGLRAALWTMNEEAEGPSRFSDLVRYAAARLAHWKGAVEFSFTGKETPIARRLAGSLLMILQEAVTNAMRHGGAEKVRVTVRFGERDMEMIVSDNGRGFDVSSVMPREDEPSESGLQGIGLSSMRQRVAALGGRFSVESSKGSGTIVTVRLPL